MSIKQFDYKQNILHSIVIEANKQARKASFKMDKDKALAYRKTAFCFNMALRKGLNTWNRIPGENGPEGLS